MQNTRGMKIIGKIVYKFSGVGPQRKNPKGTFSIPSTLFFIFFFFLPQSRLHSMMKFTLLYQKNLLLFFFSSFFFLWLKTASCYSTITKNVNKQAQKVFWSFFFLDRKKILSFIIYFACSI